MVNLLAEDFARSDTASPQFNGLDDARRDTRYVGGFVTVTDEFARRFEFVSDAVQAAAENTREREITVCVGPRYATLDAQ